MKLEIKNGFLQKKAIRFNEENLDNRLVTALRKLPCEPNGVVVEIHVDTACVEVGESREGKASEGYQLAISEDSICIKAVSGR